MKELKFPRLAYNWISAAGVLVASVAGLLMLVFFGVSLFEEVSNPYFGVFLYMILPPFLLVGLFLVPIGMWRQWRRRRRGEEESTLKWPFVDLNKRSHRNATLVFFFGTIAFLAIGSVAGYQAYHYSESVAFCGKTCHSVMKPEYTAYQNSPHARVPCTACHVGAGAGWYAKSKLSGAYQVYAVNANKYPRPIPTPIENLRPAQETCEQCHWPDKFFGAQQRQFFHYMYDEANTSWPINMLIKVGGGDPQTGQTAGIHWHMNIGFKVEYIARDQRRQDIPWVKVTDRHTGRVTVYQDSEKPLTEEEIKAGIPRQMDCMDCHNRPSHVYNSPDYAIDLAILTRKIDRSLPEIKRVAVEAMAKEYATEEEALVGIANFITDFYRANHAELYSEKSTAVDAAVVATQHAFSQNIFPEMKVRWSEYPNNIGHFTAPGCMRCHTGKLTSPEGLTLTRECRTCHTILSQGIADSLEMATSQEGLEFRHPVDISDAWQETGCYECHSGVQP